MDDTASLVAGIAIEVSTAYVTTAIACVTERVKLHVSTFVDIDDASAGTRIRVNIIRRRAAEQLLSCYKHAGSKK
jgi:hypothetical protein